MLRAYLKTPDLRIEALEIGTWTQTTVLIIFLAGVVNDVALAKVRDRLRTATLSGLVDSSRLARALGGPWLLPMAQYSERPDQVASALLGGRVAIMADNSPTALLVPARLADLLSRPADYYALPLVSTMSRILRYLSLLITVTLPALYIAAVTVNPALIPLDLYLSTIRTRLAIPFPLVVETILMMVSVDIIQEAGLIVPGALGQTVTIFGTLILGSTAIDAGIVSAPTLITVTITMLTQFLIPDYNLLGVVRILRYALVPLAAVYGVTGVVTGWVIMAAMAVRLQSLKTPYLSPSAPQRPGGWRKTWTRWPSRRPRLS
jgi:hypothetical protein